MLVSTSGICQPWKNNDMPKDYSLANGYAGVLAIVLYKIKWLQTSVGYIMWSMCSVADFYWGIEEMG